MKYRVWDDDTWTFDLEVIKRQVFAHATVKRWSMDAAKHIREVIEGISAALYLGGAREIFALAPNEKVRRFAALYNFQAIQVLPDGRSLMKYSIRQPMPVTS